MPESDATPPEPTAVKSPLEKPLHLLTEDDITQVTREDCRRYLKEKGMRRPSWNKSQAIQQVIMLKTLLEPAPDCEAGSRPNISRSYINTVPESVVPEGTSGDAENSLSPEETVPYCRKDMDKPDSCGGFSGRFGAANDEYAHPRNTGTTTAPVGQMAIFYRGKVNVYEDVPADKAQAIMHIAASPLHFPQDQLVDGTNPLQPLPGLSKDGSTRACPDSAVAIMPSLQKVKMSDNSWALGEECNRLREETPGEGPSSRKASVQRYLEKRKDRFKSKRKAGTTSCARLDVYSNNQTVNQMQRSETCSPPQIIPHSTPTRCSSVDNDSVKTVCISTGLNS